MSLSRPADDDQRLLTTRRTCVLRAGLLAVGLPLLAACSAPAAAPSPTSAPAAAAPQPTTSGGGATAGATSASAAQPTATAGAAAAPTAQVPMLFSKPGA